MDFSTLNIELNGIKESLLKPLLHKTVYLIRNGVRAQLDREKNYEVASMQVHAQFECELWDAEEDRPAVIIFESRFGHDQLAEFNWTSMFAAIVEVFDAEDNSVVAAADFIQKLQQAETSQKVACYLRIVPKTAPASE